MLTGLAVIGVARFLQQRQDYENATARSYQREIVARNRLAEGTHPAAARAAVISQQHQRQALRDEISSETRDTALLVGAGLIAGLTGAALLFTGLISSMRRPLEDLLDASGRLAGGDLDARVKVGGLAEMATLGGAFNEMAEELQRRAGERDQLDRMKDEFVLTASHELRSPLTSVQGFAELLLLEREQLSPKQAETAEVILDNTRHLVRLLNDLLDLARSDAGRLTIRPVRTGTTGADRGRGADDAGAARRSRAEAGPGDRARSAPDRGRWRPDSPSTGESAYECERVLPARSEYRGEGPPRRCRSRDRRDRRRTGHTDGAAGAHLRTLLARRRRRDPAGRWHRPRPGDLEIADRAARRHDRRRIDSRRGLDLPHPPAGDRAPDRAEAT